MSNLASSLVFFPAPSLSHFRSTLEVAKRIIQRNEHISIAFYIIKLPIEDAKFDAYIESQSRDNPYPNRLKFRVLPPLTEHPHPHSSGFVSAFFELYKPIVKQIILNNVFPKPIGFVLDMYCSSMVEVGNELDIPSYIFFTYGTNMLILMFLAQSLADDQGVDVATNFGDQNLLLTVPGFKNQITSDIVPAAFQDKENGCEMMLNFTRRIKMSKGILINTFAELESFPIQILLDNKENKFPPIYPVGPILELDDESQALGLDEDETMLEWLDSQPKLSVVFVCFGSMGYFEEGQIKELANGLEQSGYNFLWSLPKPPRFKASKSETFSEALPDGFLERVANKGKIIGWASQIKILSHPAIGGFVSHCGRNSILESLWFGVPIAAWPLMSEQQLNAFELVKELGLAVEIRIDYKKDWFIKSKGNFLVKAEEIEKGIDELMNLDEKKRGEVSEMGKKGREALHDGGSSYNSLGCFIEDVFKNVS